VRRERPTTIGGILTVFAIAITGGLASGPSASAAWSMPLSLTGDVVAGAVATTATVTALDSTITNDEYQTTHLVRAVNAQSSASSFAGTSDVNFTIDPAAPVGLGNVMSVAAWPVTAPADCTAASEPADGYQNATWADGLTTDAVGVSPNDAIYLCVRGYPTASSPSPSASASAQNRSVAAAQLGVSADVSPDGSQSFTPTYSATIRRGNFIAQAAATGAATISTSRIFAFVDLVTGSPGLIGRPLAPASTCFDISNGGDVSPPGSDLIAFALPACTNSVTVGRNQRFLRIAVPDASAVQIRADSVVDTNGFLEASPDGAVIEAQTGNVNELRQVWIPQRGADGADQLVNAATGYCAQAPASGSGVFSTAPCAANDRFFAVWLRAASATAAVTLSTPRAIGSCGVYDDVVITVTNSGQPVANTSVTVTTTAPMEMPNGTPTQTFTTNAAGQVTISGLLAPAAAGTYPITATATVFNVDAVAAVTSTNSNVFTSVAPGAFTALAGVDDPVQVDIASGVYLVRDDDGVVYRTTTASGQPLTAILGLTGATSFASYSLNGNYVVALGGDGVAYTSYGGAAFAPIAGATTLEQVDIGASFYVGRDSAGTMYRAAATVTTSQWSAITAPIAMSHFAVYDSNANYIAAIGATGAAYRSVAGGAFAPISGASDLADIQVGAGYYTARSSDGSLYRTGLASGSWLPVALPPGVAAVDYATYALDANWLIVKGSDGNAYGSYGGSAYGLIPGVVGSIDQVGVGSGYWVARNTNGVIFRSTASSAPASSGQWAAIPGLAGATDFATYEAGGAYVAAIGPSQLVC
jgi:hypothetical protein